MIPAKMKADFQNMTFPACLSLTHLESCRCCSAGLVLAGEEQHIWNAAFASCPAPAPPGASIPMDTSVEHGSGLKMQQFFAVWPHQISWEVWSPSPVRSKVWSTNIPCFFQLISGRNGKAAPNARISLGRLPVHPCCSHLLHTGNPSCSGQHWSWGDQDRLIPKNGESRGCGGRSRTAVTLHSMGSWKILPVSALPGHGFPETSRKKRKASSLTA